MSRARGVVATREAMANNGYPLHCHLSPRCGAHSRRTGQPCRAPAMKNGRCRMHGGKAGRKPMHGRYSKARIEANRRCRLLLRLLRELASGNTE
ncbi:MAG: HGGxSTG domain-containing protein [Steroidobacteraceae bacterium]